MVSSGAIPSTRLRCYRGENIPVEVAGTLKRTDGRKSLKRWQVSQGAIRATLCGVTEVETYRLTLQDQRYSEG